MFNTKSIILFVVVGVLCGTAMSNVCREDYPGYGCFEGYCCIRCDFPIASFFSNGYCWTSASNSHLAGDYIKCKDNRDCLPGHNRCAAVCNP